MVSLPSASVRTTGSFSRAPMARMAASGWLMMGMPNSPPKIPELVRVKVDPADFVGRELFGAGAAGEVSDGAGEIGEAALFGLADGRHDQSPLEGDRDAEIDAGVIVDGVVDERRVDDGVMAQGLDGGGGDEGHVGELDAVALFEGGALAIT